MSSNFLNTLLQCFKNQDDKYFDLLKERIIELKKELPEDYRTPSSTNPVYKDYIFPKDHIHKIWGFSFVINDMSTLVGYSLIHLMKFESIEFDNICQSILYAIQKYFGVKHNNKELHKLYMKEEDIDIKTLKEKNIASCMERNAVAHNLLTFFDINSLLVLGDLKSLKGSENHAYVVAEHDNSYYVLDFHNPTYIKKNQQFVASNIYPCCSKITPHYIQEFESLKGNDKINVDYVNVESDTDDSIIIPVSYIVPENYVLSDCTEGFHKK